MSDVIDRIAAFVDAILKDQRPARYPADEEEARMLQTAAALRALQPGADLPRQEFLDTLHQQLGAELSGSRPRRWSRRVVLRTSGAAAAALAAGVGLDRFLNRPEQSVPPSGALSFAGGKWVAVSDVTSVPPGHATYFAAGAVAGYVVNREGAITAMSAVCTHMGCILRFNADARRFDCPCHGASFSLAGTPLNREYLSSLPRLASRVRAGKVEVQVNPEA